ncbi:hypothetical protein [Enterobacter roggenkampii]|uniref:hypothetical protein n=1 Tax=Enterobacter roggenkampii TaxID=1812935 RepID=UPI00202088C4|nr:hypothetical protein [Enterobacter roggenkampii]MCL8152843.1 hypothetical protein [Enterobacter roggenkampii]MCM7560297.1 hypothetical protein [Enterobacter roggenkampii]
MSTISKQWLQQKIADMEATRDDIPFGLGEDGTNTLAALRIALASLEAEVAGFIVRHKGTGNFGSWLHSKADWFKSDEYEVLRAYTAPPAPVSVPTFDEWLEIRGNKPLGWVKDAMRESYEACRAAMLQGADSNSPAQSDCCPEQNYIAPAQDGDSPVIPDGWVMVPVEPTEDMIVNGFESEPDESFSDEREWEAYDAMSGCQQAAHRAKLCWAAMIAAAPKLE